MLVRTQSRDSSEEFNTNPQATWHYIFAPAPPRHQQNQWLMSPTPARTVEDRCEVAARPVERRGAVAIVDSTAAEVAIAVGVSLRLAVVKDAALVLAIRSVDRRLAGVGLHLRC